MIHIKTLPKCKLTGLCSTPPLAEFSLIQHACNPSQIEFLKKREIKPTYIK